MMKYACGAVLVLALIGVLLASAKAENEKPFDLVPFGYVFRADRPAGQNPPETQWLTNKLTDVVAGVMWEEHRPVQEVEFCFARNSPDPSLFILEVTTNTPNAGQDNRPTWWTRAWESFPGTASRSADGRRIVYRTDREAIARRLKEYPEGFRHEADPQGLLLVDKLRLRWRGTGQLPRVASFRAAGVARTVPIHLEIEWAVLPGQKDDSFDGSIEVYNGRLRRIQPLPESGVAIQGASQWHSPPVPGHRRGIAAEVSYVPDDAQEVRFHKLPREDSFPNGTDGRMTFHPNRTAVTVKTAQGSFSLRRRILIPASRFTYPVLGSSPAKPAADSRGRDSVKPGWRRGPARFGNACARCRSRASPARWTISTQPVGRSTLSRPKSRR